MTRRPVITSVELAARLGVSQATVSRALNGSPKVSAATRERVLALAQQLGYKPNNAARSLVKGRVGVIGLLTDRVAEGSMARWYINRVLRELARVGSKMGMSIITDEVKRSPSGISVASHRGQVDGIVVTQVANVEAVCAALAADGVPFILMRRHPAPGTSIPYVDTDDAAGMSELVKYLYGLGHRRIAYLGRETITNIPRVRGIKRAQEELGAAIEILEFTYSRNPGQVMETIMAGANRPTCVMCYDDETALNLLHWCHRHGVAVPGDVSITGFGDEDMAAWTIPPLTTVHYPIPEMAQIAMTYLMEVINYDSPPPVGINMPVQLVARESAGPSPGMPPVAAEEAPA